MREGHQRLSAYRSSLISRTCGVSASNACSSRVCGRSSATSRSDRNASSAATSGGPVPRVATGRQALRARAASVRKRWRPCGCERHWNDAPTATPMNRPAAAAAATQRGAVREVDAVDRAPDDAAREAEDARRPADVRDPAGDLLLLERAGARA